MHACMPDRAHCYEPFLPSSCSGLDNGIDEDEMVSLEFGSSEVMDKYKDKIKEKLQQRAAELKAEEEERLQRLAQNYLKGKEAYE
jgi:hypothetical protein